MYCINIAISQIYIIILKQLFIMLLFVARVAIPKETLNWQWYDPFNLGMRKCMGELDHCVTFNANKTEKCRDVGIADQQKAGKQSRDDNIEQFSIQPYPNIPFHINKSISY